MKYLLTFVLALGLCTANAQNTNKARLDSLMNYYYTEFDYNGVAFVSVKGETLLKKGYGYRDIDKKLKNDEYTIFQMGSNTKQFTAEVILQLAQQKKLDLQDKISKYFPKYITGDKITIENLLTHTSGIFNYTDDTSWHAHMTEHMSQETILAIFKDKPLAFTPGSKFSYSNSNYMLLGYIIESVTGKKYEQVVRENILEPTGMTHSGFDFAHLKDDNKAVGYNAIEGDEHEASEITDSSISYAAGALYSTIGDMYKWNEALRSDKLLPKEWQQKAYTPFKDRYAYGWVVNDLYGKHLIGHNGGIPGFASYEMRQEDDDLCILLMENNASGVNNNALCLNIIRCLYDTSYTIPVPEKTVPVDIETLKQYVGDYAITPFFILNVALRGGNLYLQATAQRAFKVKPISQTTFTAKEVGAEIEFVKDENGKFSKLILTQKGNKKTAIRKEKT